ncbi:hypothetical protein [Psychroserpens algicola]|uniref:Uncharacterized protein n=1 Tax=Psychroserpens algicola TaxID=1719034 RepID=A0ABT0HCI9_9FLAO|nr:hypothetical protein [Psychroserpens algicola]MCK8482073.1 hypothetical protein [Psychroserpens algicola]
MPKQSNNEWAELLKAIVPKGHRWKDLWHLCGVVMAGVFSDGFRSRRRWLVYVMYHANWLDLRETPYTSLSNEALASIVDAHLTGRIRKADIYSLLRTSPNTFKKNYADYLKLPKQPKLGFLILTLVTKWQDSKGELWQPISKQDLANLEGLYPKKIASMFVHVPQAQDYFDSIGASYPEVKAFPPLLVEQFFEEIGEPERFDALVKQLAEKEDQDFNALTT